MSDSLYCAPVSTKAAGSSSSSSTTMNQDEAIRELQENEVAVLKAIFDEAVCDLRESDVWKVHRPPELHVNLLPKQSAEQKEAHVAVTLHVKCSHFYPQTVPEIDLLKPKALSDVVVQGLKADLCRLAQELKGQEMLYPLAEYVQEFLYKHNVPTSKSFYEQMLMQKQQEADRIATEERQRKEMILRQREIENRQIEEEVEKRKTYIQQQESGPRVRFQDSIGEVQAADDTDITEENEDQSVAAVPTDKGTAPARVQRSKSADAWDDASSILGKTKGPLSITLKSGRSKAVHIIKSVTGRSLGGSFLHYALDVERDNALIVLTEWIFRWRPPRKKLNAQLLDDLKEESVKYVRQLDAIDMEMQSISKLSHPGVIRYNGWSYGFSKDHVYAHVMRNYVHGSSLTAMLKEHAPFSVEQCRLLAANLLDALSYLHANDIVHRHVRTSSVFLDSTGKFVLTDHAILKRLEQIFRFTRNQAGEMISTQRGGKKTDLLYLGILLCSASLGTVIEEEIHDIPTLVPVEMKDFLGKLLCRYDKDRPSAEQLRQHAFVTRQADAKLPYVPPTEVEKSLYKELPAESPNYNMSDLAWQLATRSLPMPSESRIHREFEIMEFCGRGGYGDVLKVRNVIDGRLYAIKRIPLNETKEKLNQRITREVQLLSRLNHENVVRYYNSWFETVAPGTETAQESSSALTTATSASSKKKPKAAGFIDSVGFFADNIENDAPPPVEGSVEWSDTDEDKNGDAGFPAETHSENDFFATAYPQNVHALSESSEDDIVFGKSDQDNSSSPKHEEEPLAASGSQIVANPTKFPAPPNVVLFIQMEFCENSTLRTCIDQGLYRDQERVWRLFREIVEGLGHIHQQGIIHRDLKPANVFIDSQDHVRIGDFGLATPMSRSTFADSAADMCSTPVDHGTDEVSRTGRIGTAMYVSPELVDNTAKAIYSQKVDMYSLGIMFFEMSYRPFATGMERTVVLNLVRKYPVLLPPDFDTDSQQRQATVVRWLCEHDPRKRPNAVELLQSDLLPPPKIEDAEVNEIIRVTVQNSQSKAYKRLMDSLFAQRTTAVTDLTYDLDVRKGSGNPKFALAFEYIEQNVIRIFRLHGAIQLHTPLLMPSLKTFGPKDAAVSLMDSSGDIVSLPYDHWVPFARYVARNSISCLKKFSIERVYRGRRIASAHPKEVFECSFDIVNAMPESQIADAECVTVISDIVNELSVLAGQVYHLRVNHTDFIRAVFISTGVTEEKIDSALDWLCDMLAESVSKAQAKQRFAHLCDFTEHGYEFLEKFFLTEGTFSQIAGSERLRAIVKRKGVAGSLAKKALQELENFLLSVERMGCNFPISVSFGFADKLIRSGIVFHVVRPTFHRNRASRPEILAIGGRYSSLAQQFVPERTSQETDFRPVVVTGVSIAFEKLVAATMASEEFTQPRAVDVYICAVGAAAVGTMPMKEQLQLQRELRLSGIKADLLMEPAAVLEDIQTHCRQLGSHLIVIKDTACTVRFLEKDRIVERKLALTEAAEWINQKMNGVKNAETTDNPASARSNFSSGGFGGGGGSGSGLAPVEGLALAAQATTVRPQAKVSFHTSGEKLAGRDRKRHSTHISNVLESVIASFSSTTTVEILAVDLPGQVLKWLPSHMSATQDGRISFEEWAALCDRFPKHRKHLKQLCDELLDQSYSPKSRLILFSILDDVYRFIT